ncbi:thiamine pyrophosphate-binding protein [Curvibacter sp. HBC28]|uniref:Thiamine pyrophosphate-binding protein n=1 Tax=Curvibacter microcysteis TaxID=3026419 RepID=A0ABT5MJ21_9BURK|nr:thiamine pyrophosphate-binding protein [Curvibacter sp. HBC28]MDD0816581.1 thiamine pyrophosphate-binding protein [Curvibacter sp. HBC28]
MNLSERIADWLVQQGITQVFAVTGGGAMYLNQALGAHPGLQCTYLHHEQACAMAAEGYARIAGKPAVVMVTTGPGGINALNGVFGAFTDSIPMLVISGQVKRATCLDYTPVPGLRQLGDQEGPVLQMARPVTKLAEGVGSPEAALTLLPQALVTAVSGRPGPVWLDIPLDVQSAACEAIPAPVFPPALTPATLDADCAHIAQRLAQAQRPLILAGTGVRLARAEQDLLAFAEAHGIPVATAWTHDLIASDHPLFAGRPGTIGTRPGNFCLQAADLVIVVGSRLNIRQVSYNWDTFAKHAEVVQVDVDPAELAKPLVQADLKITADARVFLQALRRHCQAGLPSYAPWVSACQAMRQRYGLKAPAHRGEAIHPYGLVERVSAQLREDDILVCGNASACILPFQLAPLKPGQRLFSNSGSASMGFDLPAALGAAIAAPERRVVCFAGDGSLQMNLQELQSLKSLGLNVIVVVIDNGGYLSIRLTHDNFFGRIVGATPASGVDFPDFARLATAFGLRALDVRSTADLPALDAALQQDGPQLLAVTVDPEPGFEPRIKSRALPEGGFATPELDDMFPFLPAEELAAVRAELAAVRQG